MENKTIRISEEEWEEMNKGLNKTMFSKKQADEIFDMMTKKEKSEDQD